MGCADRLHALQGIPRLDDQQRARQPAPSAVPARGAGDLAGERLPAVGQRRERARAGLLPRCAGRRRRAGLGPSALDSAPRRRGARGPGRGGGDLPRRTRVRHRLHERQGPGDRRPAHHAHLSRRLAGARRWSRPAAPRCRPCGGHSPLELPGPPPGSGRSRRPRRPARGAPPAGAGPQGPVSRPRQLHRLRAAGVAPVHGGAQLLRPELRHAGPAAEGRVPEVRLRLGHRRGRSPASRS